MNKVVSDKKNPVKRFGGFGWLFLWLVVPVILLAITLLIQWLLPIESQQVVFSENGPYELLQAACSAAAFLYALWLLTRLDFKTQKLAAAAVLLAAIGSFYITGEEISWGQQILKWDTPAYWSTVNDQNETNLHNTSAWLDQKPRLLLFIGACVGGLVIPALRRWKPLVLPQKFLDLYPGDALIVTSLGVLLPYSVQKVSELLHGSGPFFRVSEVQELYMYYFVFLYLLDMRKRIIYKV